ncbi:MAG: ABC transporter substrate-binding protein [Clostridiales bacterium]|jgi:NitT/TauT family transport system substrate-binding protein|nr:ABC transporter substrate-binding protein [Clostridiales bacterium]
MKKLKGLLFLVLCISLLVAGCSQNSSKKETKIDINIAALKGPTAMGMISVMEDAEAGNTANNYNFDIFGAADEISTGLAKGEIDIAAVPCNLASVLYNNTQGKIKLAGINTLGVLYIVETGDSIQTIEDLRGKTIYSTGLGTTPQYTLNYLLSSNGIDPDKDVTIEYKSEATEVAALLSQSEDAIAMLPQPYVTTVMMNNDKVRIALDTTKEWEAISTDGSSVVTGTVVVRSEFLEKNPKAFDAFMEEYSKSAEFVNSNVEEAAALIEKFDIFKAAVAKKAIPYCNITLIQGEEMKEKVSGYLNVLYKQNPKSIGGELPKDDFYYIIQK